MFLHIVQICFDCSNIICGIGPSTVNDERLAKTGETEMDQSGERMHKYILHDIISLLLNHIIS